MQTNAAGDNVHLIDSTSNTVVGEIGGIEVPHGAAVAPDGSRLYITNEAEHTLDVVDTRTLKVTEPDPTQRTTEQPRHRARRLARLRGDHRGAWRMAYRLRRR